MFCSESCLTLAYLEPCHIQNPSMFTTLAYFEAMIYSEPCLIQNSRHSKYRESLKYSLHRTMCNLVIFTTLVYSCPSVFIIWGILKALSNMYDGPFCTEPCITLAYTELCQISIKENLFRTMSNLSIFRTLAHWNTRHIHNTIKYLPWNIVFKICVTMTYSEP